MRSGNRSNALLVELLIVVLFFMLASTVLLQVFTTARNMSEESGWITRALTDAQNVSERLNAAEAPQEALAQMGFDQQGDEWVLTGEHYETRVTLSTEDLPAGVIRYQEVRVIREDKVLLSLPGAWYQEVRP